MEYNIAIVNSSSFGKFFPEHLRELNKLGSVKSFAVPSSMGGRDLAHLLQGYNIIIASVTPFFTEEFFNYKDELRLITRHGIGYNNVDLAAAQKHNTIVARIPALIERDAVAENNITNLLAVLRCTVEANTRVKADLWAERADFVGHSLFNKTVGVIGVGNIGSCVVEILRNGFRCEVLGYDPYKTSLEMEKHGAKTVSLNYLLATSDIICICASLTKDNYHMIASKEVSKMKDGVYISNSARGELLDEDAIVTGLQEKKIAGFATDVLEREPGRSDHPYLAFKNVVITPHIAAYTRECLEAMGSKCVGDVADIVQGFLPTASVQSQSKYVIKKGERACSMN